MLGLKNLIDHLDITLLNAELYQVGTEWNYLQVNNPYSRIYYITKGYGIIQHHDTEYLSPSTCGDASTVMVSPEYEKG